MHHLFLPALPLHSVFWFTCAIMNCMKSIRADVGCAEWRLFIKENGEKIHVPFREVPLALSPVGVPCNTLCPVFTLLMHFSLFQVEFSSATAALSSWRLTLMFYIRGSSGTMTPLPPSISWSTLPPTLSIGNIHLGFDTLPYLLCSWNNSRTRCANSGFLVVVKWPKLFFS